ATTDFGDTTMPKGRPKKQQGEQQGQNGAQSGEGGRVNKMDCVRQALTELGNDAQPKDIQDFLKRKFDLDMNTKMISTYKGSILRGAAKTGGAVRQSAARVSSRAAAPKESPKAGGRSGGISVEDIRAVKELADRLGPGKVRALMDVLYV